MDLALTINAWIDEEIIFAQQMGARQVFADADPRWPDAPGWDAQSLAHLTNRIAKAGLGLAGLHAHLPAEEPLPWTERLIQDAGKAKIDLVSLSAAPRSAWKSFPQAWLPLANAAAQAGVRLAIPTARAAKPGSRDVAHLLESLPPTVGLEAGPAYLENALQMPEDVRRQVLDRLFLVALEGRQPAGPALDDLLPIAWRLRQAGYPGLIRLGAPARWKGDTRDEHHARAYSAGYLRGVLQAFEGVGR